MNTIQNLFQQAQLAEAAYADLSGAIGDQTILKQALDVANKDQYGGTFTDAQATAFVTHWKVVDHLPDTGSGFSATLFESIDNPGVYSYAIRGTAQPLQDLLLADGQGIVRNGLAINQVVDMYNHWQRINTTAGSTYQAAQLITLTAETNALSQGLISLADLSARSDIILESVGLPGGQSDYIVKTIRNINSSQLTDVSLRTGTGGLAPLTCSALDATGHSLGGHLAAAFTRLFSETGAGAVTINGAGFPTGSVPGTGWNADTNISNLFGMLGGDASFNSAAITNIHGDGLNFVSMNSQFGLVQQGGHQEVYIESMGPSVILGHSATQMTDSLAIYNLLATVDPALNTAPNGLATLTNLIKASDNVAANSLESVVLALGKLFNVSNTTFTANEFDGNRDLLYQAVQGIAAALPANGGALPASVLGPLLDKFGVPGGAPTSDIYANCVNNVTHYYVDGEIVQTARQTASAIIGTDNPLINSHRNVGGDALQDANNTIDRNAWAANSMNGTNWYHSQPGTFDWSVIPQADGSTPLPPVIEIGPGNFHAAGSDIIYAGEGANRVRAGSGDHVVYGEGCNDTLNGEDGNDIQSVRIRWRDASNDGDYGIKPVRRVA